MFNFGTKPWLTQKWVNKILTKKMYQYYGTHKKWDVPYFGRIYKSDPEGYIPEMDDDEGTMSGWYVLSSMGLYPVVVGDPVFQISSPIFDKVTIHLPDEKDFVIKTKNYSDKNFYIQKAKLNGREFNQTFITHNELSNGGILEYTLGEKPNKDWIK
jgi:putative alpha-1,2-mannosidase